MVKESLKEERAYPDTISDLFFSWDSTDLVNTNYILLPGIEGIFHCSISHFPRSVAAAATTFEEHAGAAARMLC